MHTVHCIRIAYSQTSVSMIVCVWFYSSFLVTSCVCSFCLCLCVCVLCVCAAPSLSVCVCVCVCVWCGTLCCGGGVSADSRGQELGLFSPALRLRASQWQRYSKFGLPNQSTSPNRSLAFQKPSKSRATPLCLSLQWSSLSIHSFMHLCIKSIN